MIRRTFKTALAGAILAAAFLLGLDPAFAGHQHYVKTPNGGCHQVASGQTGIDDDKHGGWHRFHDNVHVGATDAENVVLGQGKSRVEVVLGSDE